VCMDGHASGDESCLRGECPQGEDLLIIMVIILKWQMGIHSKHRFQGTLQPIVIRDGSRCARGFLAGLSVALLGYISLFLHLRSASQEEVESAASAIWANGQITDLAIARAEEINMATAAFVETCGQELAEREWREAGAAEARYELLTSFIAFSPTLLDDYMPGEFEIVLWEDLREAGVSKQDSVTSPKTKVALLAGGTAIEY
jgi:hypothetical protein